ncbi:MAG TPA: hypothetical protein VN836_01610 [Verrucomicrobiae bacterium]|nr:hypothetical protein [Verrucomicrobiae bacterium]
MKTNLAKYVCSLLLPGAVATATAQSTWNYFISDAGGGNSLVTWSVTGSLATSPGAVLVLPSQSSLAVSVETPGIYADTYVANGTPQSLPTPDGSYFTYGVGNVYTPISGYYTDNAPGNGNDSFGLTAFLPPRIVGIELLYNPGTQSVLIPVDFSNFNPGTYQSEESGFNTPLTVNLTVEPVPEPSTLALAVSAVIGAALTSIKGKKLRFNTPAT